MVLACGQLSASYATRASLSINSTSTIIGMCQCISSQWSCTIIVWPFSLLRSNGLVAEHPTICNCVQILADPLGCHSIRVAPISSFHQNILTRGSGHGHLMHYHSADVCCPTHP